MRSRPSFRAKAAGRSRGSLAVRTEGPARRRRTMVLALALGAATLLGSAKTALHWSASKGDVDATRMLIYAGARLDAVTRNGNYTPLHLAAKAGNVPVVK